MVTQTGSAWKRKQRGLSNTPGTLSKSDNFRGEGNAERGESEHARAKPPPKSWQRGGLLRWLYPLQPPTPAPLPPGSQTPLDPRTGCAPSSLGRNANRYVCVCARIFARAYPIPNVFTSFRINSCAYIINSDGPYERVEMSNEICNVRLTNGREKLRGGRDNIVT